jgi:hypothetical protein
MRKFNIIAVLIMAAVLQASATSKIDGTTTLKDSQPAGTPDKDHKHQAYDLSFEGSGKAYTCRTDPKKSMNATDFVVGNEIRYYIDGNKGKIKTSNGKQVECKIVRVENLSVNPR